MSSSSKLRDYFERIYVINLPYKEDRRDRLTRHLAEVGIADPGDLSWVRAISGDWCWPPAYFQAGGGAWGCLQSHVRIVQDAIMDGIENYLVLEDDAVFQARSPELLARLMRELPDDWGQIYLGGQHLKDPEPVSGRPFVFRCNNVNRTHAFALHKRAMVNFQQHVSHAPDYISRGGWHIDHQLGIAHERGTWKTYAPAWWIAGQDEGASNISGRSNPRLWWHPARFSSGLPFIHVETGSHPRLLEMVRQSVHFGNQLKGDTLEDIGLDACVGSQHALEGWLAMIAREAMDMGLLPGIYHPGISAERVGSCWKAGVYPAAEADLSQLIDYPFNSLFPHPVNGADIQATRGSSAA
jgi:hypothetical protein